VALDRMRLIPSLEVVRRRRYRPKCEHFLELDIRDLHREGALRSNSTKMLRVMSRERGLSAVVRADAGKNCIRLSHAWTAPGGVPRSMNYFIVMERETCRFGGYRAWFRCPRCNARRAILYGLSDDGRFGCRGCMQLIYAGQDESRLSRLWRKQRKLERKLASDRGRLRGMHVSTHKNIIERLNAVLVRENRLFCDGARVLFRRKGWVLRFGHRP